MAPETGGKLAAAFLTGTASAPTRQSLLEPATNIAYGSAYLHLLTTRHFKGVEKRLSRRYLVVAAYHAGAADVISVFAGSRGGSDAVRRINRLSPATVFRRLMQRLPYKETKQFLENVTIDLQRWDRAVLAERLRPLGKAPEVSKKVAIRRFEEPQPGAARPGPPGAVLARRPPPTPVRPPPRSRRARSALKKFQNPVIASARKYKIKPSLVLSVIKNESAFDPEAVSRAGALGLMQLVPTSGGREAMSFLRGRTATPTRELLFTPDFNIELGTTYLHLLLTRHLGKVENETSRRYAAIASYNTGLSNVARAITGRRNVGKAIERINGMTPDEVYRALMTGLPYGETKAYLARVRRDIALFIDVDDLG